MEILIAIIAGVLLAVVFVVISAPLRAARDVEDGDVGASTESEQALQAAATGRGYERAELEAARETKYREIRDAELDLRTGKLSREDYDAIDSGLRAEALELLDRLEALEPLEQKPSGESLTPGKANPELEA
ncbi:MAG TPA: hypothetical protein VG188_07960 [Solirubrobacteraceae bacterium]|nr:hypothetical protein [Solirubrobacteraceae bacterium]